MQFLNKEQFWETICPCFGKKDSDLSDLPDSFNPEINDEFARTECIKGPSPKPKLRTAIERQNHTFNTNIHITIEEKGDTPNKDKKELLTKDIYDTLIKKKAILKRNVKKIGSKTMPTSP